MVSIPASSLFRGDHVEGPRSLNRSCGRAWVGVRFRQSREPALSQHLVIVLVFTVRLYRSFSMKE